MSHVGGGGGVIWMPKTCNILFKWPLSILCKFIVIPYAYLTLGKYFQSSWVLFKSNISESLMSFNPNFPIMRQNQNSFLHFKLFKLVFARENRRETSFNVHTIEKAVDFTLRWTKEARSGVNFINVLRTAFALVDPKSVKRYWRLDWTFTLLGATGAKAVRRNVDEIEPRCQFHQHIFALLLCP